MKNQLNIITYALGILLLPLIISCAESTELKPVYPQVNRLETAILKPGQLPAFSWGLDAGGKDGAAQTAYQIRVAGSEKALGQHDFWNSGKTISEETLDMPYGGKPLPDASQFVWQVRVFDENGTPSDWSKPQRFFTGLKEWSAQWITTPEFAAIAKSREELLKDDKPVRMFRKEWDVPKPVRRATLYITSLGSYEAWINGQLVSEDKIAPSVTHFGYRIFYRAYDVGGLLKQGPNAIAALVGDGRYRRNVVSEYGSDRVPRLLAQMEIEYENGTRESVGTDSGWQSMQELSPWQKTHHDRGGVYDARLFDAKWLQPGYASKGWQKAIVLPAPAKTIIDPEMVQPCRVFETLNPVATFEPEPGVYVFDFGKKMTGVCRFTVSLPEGGELRLRHSEFLRKDKSLDVSNLRHNDKNETVYISAGGKNERFEGLPFHFNGFRYVEVRGLPSRKALKSLDAIHFGDAMRPVSAFYSSDDRLNRLWNNMSRTFVSLLKSGIIVDVASRDEREGWFGDIYTANIPALGYFFDGAAHHRKRMQDIRDKVASRNGSIHPGQVGDRAPGHHDVSSPYWSDAASIPPRDAYVFYADRDVIERQYGDGEGQAKALLSFYAEQNGSNGGKWINLGRPLVVRLYGPWLDRATQLPPGSGRDRWNSLDYPSEWFKGAEEHKNKKSVSKEAFGTAWWSLSAGAVADMAEFLGKDDESRYYRDIADRCKTSLLRDFDNGDGTWDLDDQPVYTYGLYTGAAGGKMEDVFLQKLVGSIKAYGGHISSGTDVPHMTLNVLSRHGYADLAYHTAMRPEMPSFGYMVDAGATAMWECFTLYHPEWGLSKIITVPGANHASYVNVVQWIVEDVVGLRPDPKNPGFRHFFIIPWTGTNPESVDFSFDSPRGPIRVAWERKGELMTLHATVPPNTTATVRMPDGKEQELASGTHVVTGSVPQKTGEGIGGNYEAIRKYFLANPYEGRPGVTVAPVKPY